MGYKSQMNQLVRRNVMDRMNLMMVIEHACPIVSRACQFNGDKAKNGAYLSVTDWDGRLHVAVLIGEVPDKDNALKYASLCQEKALRLAQFKEHVSSWQSRNESENKWGGAIRVQGLIFSFSGLPEHWDEACAVTLAYSLSTRLLSKADYELIKHTSGNPHLGKLLNTMVSDSERLPM